MYTITIGPGGSHHFWADPFPELVTCLKCGDLSEVRCGKLTNQSFHTFVVALEALFKRGNGQNILKLYIYPHDLQGFTIDF